MRASLSIPFFFERIKFRATAGRRGFGRWLTVTWVDGRLFDNSPADVFDRTDGAVSQWPTIRINLSAPGVAANHWRDADGAFDQALACFHSLPHNADRLYITPERPARRIFVDSAGVNAADFGIQPADRTRFFDNGVVPVPASLAVGSRTVPAS